MDVKELFLMIEAISNEKNIAKEEVFASLEEALAVATRKHKKIDARIALDHKNGTFATFRRWLVVDDDLNEVDEEGTPFDENYHIRHKDAKKMHIGDYVETEIESMAFGRIATQIAKQVIIQKVREAERAVVVEDYSKRVGTIVSVLVRRVDKGNVYVDMGGVDGMMSKFDLIPNESIRKNDRIRAYIKDVKSTPRGAQIFLSRTAGEMMDALFTMEVPEISEGTIEIKGVARDPGIRAKIAVKAKDRRLDPIGSCIGMRGSRVQAVSNELNGERIDVILWDESPAQFVINALAPANVHSIVVDEEKATMDVVVEDDTLAQAIGKNGQNIRLASKLTGWNLNVMSRAEADEKRAKDTQKSEDKLAEQLGVDAEVATILIEEGYTTIDKIIDAEAKHLAEIAEFDETMAEELQDRAQDAQLVRALGDAEANETLMKISEMDADLSTALIHAEINSQAKLAELSADELLEIKNIDAERAAKIIIEARENEGWFDEKSE